MQENVFYMELIGAFLVLASIGRFYVVFFDTKSDRYWKTSLFGGKFEQGCITPLVCFIIGAFMIIAKLF
jgi:hypothetical protein